MASIKPPISRALRSSLWLAYAGVVALFLVICVPFYVRGKGFTYLERFGTNQSAHYIRELRAINHYEEEDSDGYDGQHYAQIAMHPWLSNPGLKRAIDNLPYRARRILFSATAYGLAMGSPKWALQIYAVQNIVCWLVLAGLMLRWFPPVNWGNFLRWSGVLFSSGLCLSVRSALVDGPSLLLIAFGMVLIEKERPWWSALLLGVSGLGKETNILAAAALPLPAPEAGVRRWLGWVMRGALVLLPIAAWVIGLRFWLGASGGAGMRNFAWPFAGYFGKWEEIWRQLGSGGINSITDWNLLTMMVALTVQWLFFAPSCIEPAILQAYLKLEIPAVSAAWGSTTKTFDVLDQALSKGPWLLGDDFSAADIAIGAGMNYAIRMFKMVPTRPNFDRYLDACAARPAFQTAQKLVA